jgi:phage repressor protein C with HTH and peptisase S24 domain
MSARLKAWRARRDLTQLAAAQALGVTRSYYSQLENGRRSAGLLADKFALLEHQPGPLRVNNNREHSVNNRDVHSGEEIIPLPRRIPLVSWAQAGEAVDYDELPASWQKVVPTDIDDPKAFAITIAGDSMEPRYHENDVALLTPSKPVRQNDAVVARLEGQGVVFKLCSRAGDTFRFSSYNPAYAPFEVPAAQVVWIYPVHSVLKIVSK